MRVLCIVPQNVKHETDMFIGLKQQGVDIHVLTAKKTEPDFSKLNDAGISVEVVEIRKKLDRSAIEKIRSVLEDKQIQIAHAFNNKTVSNSLAACKNMPVKFIAYRGIVGNVSFLNPGSWMTYLNPRVSRIICVANAIRDHLRKLRLLWFKIPPHKLVTIYKGHDMAWYQSPPATLTEFGIPNDAFVVGCTANYRPRKGIDVLIRCCEHLPENAKIHFLLIGHMDSPKLAKKIDASPYRDRIHVTGFRDNAPEIIAACDVCVLPSIKREGLPKTIIEGMAYAVPPIVTNSGGSPELVENNISGIIVPPKSAQAIAQAIMYLHDNPTRKKQMGKNAQERIKKSFNIKHTIEKTHSLYKELISES